MSINLAIRVGEAWNGRAVTWPRTKYSILGKRDDGTVLAGEYFTNLTETKEVELHSILVLKALVLTNNAKSSILLRNKEGKITTANFGEKDSKFIVSINIQH